MKRIVKKILEEQQIDYCSKIKLICGGCKNPLPLSDFAKNKRTITGYQFYCKACYKIKFKSGKKNEE